MMKRMEKNKKIKKIGTLAVLGILISLIVVSVPVAADDDYDWETDGTDVWTGHGTGGYPGGYVGIGVNNPLARLDVRNSGTEDILRLHDGSTQVFTVLDGGNVGIGTAAPQRLLHLSLVGSPEIVIENSGANPNQKIWRIRGESGSVSNLHFDTVNDAFSVGTTVMTLSRTGNVGIGAPIPGAKLEVAGAIKISGPVPGTHIFYGTNEVAAPTGDGYRIRYDNNFFGTNDDALIIEKTDANDLFPDGGIAFVNTGNRGDVEPAMVIKGNGNVGIGTMTPYFPLEVRQSANLGINYEAIVIRSGISDGTARMYMNSDDRFVLQRGANTNQLVLANDGNVGIGDTPTSTNKLRVISDTPTTGNIRAAIMGGTVGPFTNIYDEGYGVFGLVDPDSTDDGEYFGVAGAAISPSLGTHYGVYGTASGGSKNWAGYFEEGNVYIGNALHINNTVEYSTGEGVLFENYYLYPTSDDNYHTIAIINTEDDHMYALKTTICGISTDGAEGVHWVVYKSYKNDGGTLNYIGDASVVHSRDTEEDFAMRFYPSGSDILIQVRGKTGINMRWQATVETSIIASN